MKIKAYGKVNISLDVIGKREDGYHLLRMLMQTVDIYDELIFEKVKEGVHITCDKDFVPTDKRNLVYKAVELFKDTFKVQGGVKVHINKNIPVEAGMAGGSTDAAAALKGMRDLYMPEVSDKELMKLGVRIGADVPYCILGGTALCEGIGEVITPLKSFNNKIMVVVKPDFGVSTVAVYKAFDINSIETHPNTENLMEALKNDDVHYVANNMMNLLEKVTIKNHEEIQHIKEYMVKEGSLGAMMSGSGPTVFGFFDDMLTAQRCYDKLKDKYKEVFITRTV